MFRGMGFGLFFINFDFERPFLAGGFLFLFDDGGLHLGGLRRGDGFFLPVGLCKRGEGDSLMTVLDKRDGLRSGDRLDLDRPLLEDGEGVFLEDDDGDRLGGRLNGLFILSRRWASMHARPTDWGRSSECWRRCQLRRSPDWRRKAAASS